MRLNGKAFRPRRPAVGALRVLWLLAWIGWALSTAGGARADQAGPVTLVPGVSAEGLEASARYALDDGRSVDAVAQAFAAGGGVDLGAALDARENPYQALWALVPLRNAGAVSEAPEAGGAPVVDRWILTSATYGMLAVEAYLLRADGTRDYVMSHVYDEPYDPADHSASRVRSEPVAIPRGAGAHLLTRLRFGPVTDVRLALETEDDLTARAFREGFVLAAFYAFAIAMLVFFLGFHLSLSNAIGVAYAGLFSIGLLLIAYVDGLTFRFLYPERPEWHFAFGVAAMNLFSAAGFVIAGRSLRGAAPRIARHALTLQRLGLLPLAAIGSTVILPQEAVAGLSYGLVLAMFALQAGAIWLWRRESGEPQRIERAVALMATVMIAAIIGMIATGLGARLLSPPAMLRSLYGLVGLLSMLALTMALVDLRRRHAQAVEARMAALEQEAASARARLEAERRYARARDLAELRHRRLATASHDIRQPLAAIRMRLSAAGEGLSETDRGGVTQALDYLEQLSTDYLAEARPAAATGPVSAPGSDHDSDPGPGQAGAGASPNDDETEPDHEAEPEAAQGDPYPVSLVLGAVRQMFSEDAVSKGLQLRVVERSLETSVDPLALIRIVSNLTSNAIRHTGAGRVLVGARSRGQSVEIIVADTGPGFAEGGFEQLSQAWAKGAASEGEGLGLSICLEQAQRLGVDLAQRAPPGKGACFVLTVPRAATASG